MLHAIFFTCATLVVYHYALYPALVMGLAWLRSNSHAAPLPPDPLPTLTVVIAAYNEERVIATKIENTLALRYPTHRLRVLVAADGSTDATVDIARRYGAHGVTVLHRPERRGKTAALNRAVASVDSDIVVFSDANNYFDEDALVQLVRHFADPRIGGVCGLKQIYDSASRESSVGDGLYWRYEAAIKLAESRLGSITTADGEIFAIRRQLFRPIDERLINDDAAITFDLVHQGYRVVYEPAARSYEHASIRIEDDFHVKTRMVTGGFQTLVHYRRLLLPPRSWFAIAFLSHKVLRWIAPALLILMAVTSVLLSAQPFFFALTVAQGAFYTLAAFGWLARRRQRTLALYVPFYFCAMNLAALHGLARFLRGRYTPAWRKAER